MSNTCCLVLGVEHRHAEFRSVMYEILLLAQLSRTPITLLWLDDLDDTLFPRACLRVETDQDVAKDALENTLLHYAVIADSVWITETEAWEMWRWKPTPDGHRAR